MEFLTRRAAAVPGFNRSTLEFMEVRIMPRVLAWNWGCCSRSRGERPGLPEVNRICAGSVTQSLQSWLGHATEKTCARKLRGCGLRRIGVARAIGATVCAIRDSSRRLKTLGVPRRDSRRRA